MKRDEVLEILSHYRATLKGFGVKSLAIFGSVARNEAGPDSDVDILVEFDQPVGLFELAELKEYLESVLGKRVDLATPGALRPHMREQIMREAVLAT